MSTDLCVEYIDSNLIHTQRNSVPVRHFQRFFGTLAVTRTMPVLPSNKTLTSICPTDERIFMPSFRRHPLQDISGVLEHTNTVYLLFDRPGRVFLHTKLQSRIFGNIWLLNSSLIFRGLYHVPCLVTFSLIYFQIALGYLRESDLSEPLVHDIIYDTLNSPWCTTAPSSVPD